MSKLIIKKYVRLKNLKNPTLFDTPHQKKLCGFHSPRIKRGNQSLIGWRISGSHNRYPKCSFVTGIVRLSVFLQLLEETDLCK